jgi:hypothetical protein
MTPATVRFAKLLLQEKISEQLTGVKPKVQGIFSSFNEVHLYDSTSILLPDELVKDFLGNNNCKHKRKAIDKIEMVYNFTNGSFSFFDLLSFSKNDQSLGAPFYLL